MKPHCPHPDAPARRIAVTRLVKLVVAEDGDETFRYYQRKVLDTLIWKYSEADGKWNTRHRSESANQSPTIKHLRHDHVYTKKSLIDELMTPGANIAAILGRAIGCVVTENEHAVLSRFDKSTRAGNATRLLGLCSKVDAPSVFIDT